MTNLILLVHRDSKPKSAYIKVKMWTLPSNWAFLDGLYWDLSELLFQERHLGLFLMWTHSLMCRESYSIQRGSWVFQNLTFLLSTFKSLMVSCEREQEASEVSARHAAPSRLDWWNLEQPPGWIFTARTFLWALFHSWKSFGQNSCRMWQTVKADVHSEFYQASPWRESTPSMCCGNPTQVGIGSLWDAFPRKCHGFLCLRDCWWIRKTYSSMTFLMFLYNIYNLQ